MTATEGHVKSVAFQRDAGSQETPRRLFENRKPPPIRAVGVSTVVQVEFSRHPDNVIRRKLDFSTVGEYWTGERPPERGDRYLVNQES